MNPCRRHFSLVELTVVLVVAPSILAGLLLPALGRDRKLARHSNCISNQKQLMLGLEIFANMFDNRFPSEMTGNKVGNKEGYGDYDSDHPLLAFDPDAAPIAFIGAEIENGQQVLRANQIFFNRLLQQNGGDSNAAPEVPVDKPAQGGMGVVADYRVFRCPSTRAPTAPLNERELFTAEKPVSYGANFRITGGSTPHAISLGDSARGQNPTLVTAEPEGFDDPRSNPASGVNHGGEGFNFGFRDGHAKWYKGAPAGQTLLAIRDASSGPNKSILHSVGNKLGNDGKTRDDNNVEDIALF